MPFCFNDCLLVIACTSHVSQTRIDLLLADLTQPAGVCSVIWPKKMCANASDGMLLRFVCPLGNIILGLSPALACI